MTVLEELPADVEVAVAEPAPTTLARSRAPRRIRPVLHRTMTAKRAPLVRVHRWLSLLLMLWIVVESLTGAGIVFAGEIDRIVNSDQFRATSGDVGMPDAVKSARVARPNDLVRLVAAPGAEDGHGMYWVYTTGPEGDYHVVLVDPGSGEVTSDDHRPPLVVRWMQDVHYNLNSTSVFGFDPLQVMGWMAVGWLATLMAGGYIWYWPGIKRWANAVRVRRKRGAFTFHLDLHKAVGVVVLVPLAAVVVTGINFAFPDQVRSVWNIVTFGNVTADDVTVPLSTRAPGREPISSQQAIESVLAVDPSVTVQYVTGPGGSPIGVYDIDATVDSSFFGTLGGERTVEFAVDQYTGGVISIADPADKGVASQAYDDWSYQVHFGTFGGSTTKWLWVLLGLSPLLLGITGTRMWFVRRAKRRRRSVSFAADPVLIPTPTVGQTDEEEPS